MKTFSLLCLFIYLTPSIIGMEKLIENKEKIDLSLWAYTSNPQAFEFIERVVTKFDSYED